MLFRPNQFLLSERATC